jgi:hypothetical protein
MAHSTTETITKPMPFFQYFFLVDTRAVQKTTTCGISIFGDFRFDISSILVLSR